MDRMLRIEIKLGTLIVGCALLAVVMTPPVLMRAGTLDIPNTFSANTPAVAAEVNDNFLAVKTEVDDNNSQILALDADLDTLQSDFDSLGELVIHHPPLTSMPDNALVIVNLGDQVAPWGTFRSNEDDILFSQSGTYLATLFIESNMNAWRPVIDGNLPFTVNQSVGDLNATYLFSAVVGTTLQFEVQATGAGSRGAIIQIAKVGP